MRIKRASSDVCLASRWRLNNEIWFHETGSTLNFIGYNNFSSPLLSSPLLSSPLLSSPLTSILAHFPSSLMHLQQFVRLLWLITHLITTTHRQRLSAVLMHYRCSGTSQAWSAILTEELMHRIIGPATSTDANYKHGLQDTKNNLLSYFTSNDGLNIGAIFANVCLSVQDDLSLSGKTCRRPSSPDGCRPVIAANCSRDGCLSTLCSPRFPQMQRWQPRETFWFW